MVLGMYLIKIKTLITMEECTFRNNTKTLILNKYYLQLQKSHSKVTLFNLI